MTSAQLTKKFYSVHSWLGLISGIFLLVISLTGTLLVFGPEIDQLLARDKFVVAPPAMAATRQPLDALVATLRRQYPRGRLINLRPHSENPTLASIAEVQPTEAKTRLQVFLDPYTGAVVATRDKDATLVKIALQLHERLLWKGPGEVLVGLVALALLGATITGLVVYRKSLLKPFRTGIRFDRGLRLTSSDAHKLIGVSTLLFNLMIATTGFLFHADKFTPGHYAAKKKEEARPKHQLLAQVPAGLDALVARATARVPGLRTEVVDFPVQQGMARLRVKGNTPASVALLGKHNVEVDLLPASATVLTVKDIRQAALGEQLKHIADEIHFGRYGGWPVKVLYALLGLMPGLLSVSGFILWKKKPAKKAIPAVRPGRSRPINAHPVPLKFPEAAATPDLTPRPTSRPVAPPQPAALTEQ
jgi:uncharacterized iron-regulated membrane protein